MRYMVRGIPTVMLFKGGQIVDQVVGLVDKGTLKQMVDKHIWIDRSRDSERRHHRVRARPD